MMIEKEQLNPDFINAIFESVGALILWLNIQKLVQDKKVAGVRILPTVFWAVWGLWNLYYYPAIGQMISFYAGIGLVVVNALWVGLAVYYSRGNRRMA